MENKYHNGKIYRLINDLDDEFYIGSTCSSLSSRLSLHRHDAKSGATSRKVRYKYINVYKL